MVTANRSSDGNGSANGHGSTNGRVQRPLPPAQGRTLVRVRVEEASIHCAKHIPRMIKVPREIAWGTDDVWRRRAGDFFEASCEPRPWVEQRPDEPVRERRQPRTNTQPAGPRKSTITSGAGA